MACADKFWDVHKNTNAASVIARPAAPNLKFFICSPHRLFVQSGRHREISIDAGRQTVLDRSACLIDAEAVELRFTIDLPGAGRRILGRKAATLLVNLLPEIINHSALAHNLDLEALEHHAATVEDQWAVRAALADAGLVAFVANGAVLPRRSGVDDRPLSDGVKFLSPPPRLFLL